MKHERVVWPPKRTYKPVVIKEGSLQMHNVRDGEPDLVVLERYDGDRTLRGNKLTYCCDCGLGHVFSYEIFKVTGSGEQYAMNIRAFRLPDKVKGATRHKGK